MGTKGRGSGTPHSEAGATEPDHPWRREAALATRRSSARSGTPAIDRPRYRLRRVAAFLAGALLAGFVCQAASAQQPGQAQRVDRLTALFTDMSAETGVRVSTPTLYIEHGAFRSLEPRRVRIAYGGSVVPVELADIRSLQVERHHPVQGMLWGLGSGLLVGGVGGLLVASFYCDEPVSCQSEERRGAVIGGAGLGIAGGIAGFVIGRHQVSWSPVFP